MNGGGPIGAPAAICEAVSAGDGMLIAAGEPLAGLQRLCGGTIPGVIAIPALGELVAQARALGLRLARAIAASDGEARIRAWVEVDPGGNDGDCAIAVHSWYAVPLAGDPGAEALQRRTEIDRALAELTAQLDAGQRLLAVDSDAADLRGLAQAMRGGLGRAWTDFVTLPGETQRQPLHWRMLDGAMVTAPGSARAWRAVLVPVGGDRGEAPRGFELLLVSDEAPAPLAAPGPAAPPPHALIGGEIAPELRRPIARIIANAETIRARLAGPLAEDYSRYAGEIAGAGQHLLALVDDLADLEAIERADFAPVADRIDLSDVARRAAGILGVRARDRGIRITVGEGAAVWALAEFRRALQILLNLIGNAVRYAPENSVVNVTVEHPGDAARITVGDSGPGLSADQAGRVFDKFERLGRSGDGGSGLGLFISRRLARAMGGDLTVDSTPGAGARFMLDLPAAG